MSQNNLPLDELSTPFAAVSKGPKILAQWLEHRTQKRYDEFIRAAVDADVLPENAEAMTADDLFAMLKALELDIEGEKAALYGRLARSIAMGEVAEHLKRHFIRSLSELSFGQADLLRRSWIASRFDLFPGVGSGRVDPKELLAFSSPQSIDRLTFERMGMLNQSGLSQVGAQFVEACFTDQEREPVAAGYRVWAAGMIHIVCNEIGVPACDAFLHRLTDDGHRNAIKVVNGAAFRGYPCRPYFATKVMVVLLTHDPQCLTKHWSAVEEAVRGRAVTVVAATAPDAVFPRQLGNVYRHINASPDNLDVAVQDVHAIFEQHGFNDRTAMSDRVRLGRYPR